MNRTKAVFIFFAFWYWVALLGITLYLFYSLGVEFATIGMAIVSVFPIGFFLSLNIINKPRTSPNQVLLTLLILIGLLWTFLGYRDLGPILLTIYGFNFIIWLLYVHWYSRLDVHESSVLVLGNTLPELVFTTYPNKPFYASSLLGKKVVYIFYRGNWCPVDMAQIREISRQYSDLEERGAEVLLISPQPYKESEQLAEKSGINFRFVTDDKNKMAGLLEIENKDGVPFGIGMKKYAVDTVFPTVVITNELGKIIYLDQTTNYRVRPEPDTIISAIGA